MVALGRRVGGARMRALTIWVWRCSRRATTQMRSSAQCQLRATMSRQCGQHSGHGGSCGIVCMASAPYAPRPNCRRRAQPPTANATGLARHRGAPPPRGHRQRREARLSSSSSSNGGPSQELRPWSTNVCATGRARVITRCGPNFLAYHREYWQPFET
jgi:hypothetical protein